MKSADQLTADEQSAILAERYTLRAEAYDALWSPVIRPVGERLLAHLPLSRARNVIDVGTGAGALLPLIQRAAPEATVLGVDRSEGMLRLAKERHVGPLALMDAQKLDLPSDHFDAAVLAFVLFHLPSPARCLTEVNRVLRPGGIVGTLTWANEPTPPANTIWDEELAAAGACVMELPAVDNLGLCDSPAKMAALLADAGFASSQTWAESLEHRWQPEAHFEYHIRSTSRVLLDSLRRGDRDACLRRVRDRLSRLGPDQYHVRSEVVMATAVK
jgi:ubiquinone/menaquinone biosynthesis C-methylase UbiE